MIDIKIGEYLITTDEVQFILQKGRVVQKEDSENYGKTEYRTEGYYGSLEGLMQGLVKKMVVTTSKDIKTLSQLSELVKDISDMVKSKLEI